jgi:LmbE family N-acetylglucosaminyl deacetylase
VTATRGEHGTDDPDTFPPDVLARHRERELAESLRVVGVEEHGWLGYADGSLAAADRHLAVTTLQRLIAEVTPDTIVTFGPDGMTGHTDHRTISSWATEAWRRSGSPAALWYATLTPDFHATWGTLNEQLGLWFEGSQPPVSPTEDLAARVVCDGSLLDLKHRALRAHASQTRGLEERVGAATYRSWWSTECFVAAELAQVTRSSAAVVRGRRRSSYAGRRGLRPPASA